MASKSSERAANPVSNWLHYYYSMSQSLLNPEAVEAATQEEDEAKHAPQRRRRPSNVRFMESVSVRHLEVQEDDRHDLYYSKQDIASFQQEQDQEKERQAQERKQAKRSIREQRKLKLAQRKAERARDLTTAGVVPIRDKEKTQTSTTPPRPLRKSNLLLGDFLAKTKKSVTPMESAQDARDAFSVF